MGTSSRRLIQAEFFIECRDRLRGRGLPENGFGETARQHQDRDKNDQRDDEERDEQSHTFCLATGWLKREPFDEARR